MSDPFVKLYATLLESSLWWGEDAPTRLVWITLLVAADHRGIYSGTLPGLAGKARVTLDEARHAVWRLQQPDEESRTKDYDGRRVEVIEGVGIRLLNYEKYREKRSEKQVQDAHYKAQQRARQKSGGQPDMSGESGEVSILSPLSSKISDLGSDPDPERATHVPVRPRVYSLPSERPDPAYLDAAVMAGVSREQAASTWEHYWGAGLPANGVEKLHPWLIKRASGFITQTTRVGGGQRGARNSGTADALEYAMRLGRGEEP